MFLKFSSNEQRRAYGGSDFLELQYCTLPAHLPDRRKVDENFTRFWDLASLYVYGDNMNKFYNLYGDIFGDGLYANQKTGPIDLCGINYYSPARCAVIFQRLQEKKPQGYELLTGWLQQGALDRGFYLLGV